MKTYLSFGGGVNSVAMMLLLLDEGIEEFEAVFVDHGTDWPETYKYFDMFQGWLTRKGYKPITVLKPNVEGFTNLYDFYWHKKWVPSHMRRICTDKFKIRPLFKYFDKPCFCLLGIDAGEAKRAKISVKKGIENRWPLIERDIDRANCKKIIIRHGLPLPQKSGCFICPFQRKAQWIELRRIRPELFCKAEQLEKRNMEYRKSKGKTPLYLSASKKPLRVIVNEAQGVLWEELKPPCQCGL